MLYPTAYFRWVRNDLGAPNRVLQQWWTGIRAAQLLMPPEQCGSGEWRDVPTAE